MNFWEDFFSEFIFEFDIHLRFWYIFGHQFNNIHEFFLLFSEIRFEYVELFEDIFNDWFHMT